MRIRPIVKLDGEAGIFCPSKPDAVSLSRNLIKTALLVLQDNT